MGFDQATLIGMPGPVMFDPALGPVFLNPTTGQPETFGPNGAVPFTDPLLSEVGATPSDLANTGVNEAIADNPAAVDANALAERVRPTPAPSIRPPSARSRWPSPAHRSRKR